MSEILRRRYKVRGQGNRGLQITLPPEVNFKKGDQVTLLHNGFVLIVPVETPVDEQMVKEAIKLRY